MATIKSHTDISQAKALIEILPLESADMHYVLIDSEKNLYSPGLDKYIGILPHHPAWSLSALLGVIKSAVEDYTMQSLDCKKNFIVCKLGDKLWSTTALYDNEIDACYEMILKLHELNLL